MSSENPSRGSATNKAEQHPSQMSQGRSANPGRRDGLRRLHTLCSRPVMTGVWSLEDQGPVTSRRKYATTTGPNVPYQKAQPEASPAVAPHLGGPSASPASGVLLTKEEARGRDKKLGNAMCRKVPQPIKGGNCLEAGHWDSRDFALNHRGTWAPSSPEKSSVNPHHTSQQ